MFNEDKKLITSKDFGTCKNFEFCCNAYLIPKTRLYKRTFVILHQIKKNYKCGIYQSKKILII